MNTPAERFNAAVGRQVRAEISAAGSSVAAMARRIGIARSALDNYVKGERSIPVPIVYAVCDAVQIEPHVLVERAEQRFVDDEATTSKVTPIRRKRPTAPAPLPRVAKKRSRDRGGDDGQG